MKAPLPASAARPARFPVARATAQPSSTAPTESASPCPSTLGSVLCVAGLLFTGLTMSGRTPAENASYAAIGIGLSLAASIVADARLGFQNLVRTDLMALLALYFLTFVEYLFPQKYALTMDVATTRKAIIACLVGFAGMVIGRHLVSLRRRHPFAELCKRPAPQSVLFLIFWACFLVGYLYMLMAVHFNVREMIDYFMAPRFYQPWGRGRLGDWKALIVEIGAVINLVPPMGGILLARWRKFSKVMIALVAAGVLFTLFYGFSTGTRNIFASYMVTFLIGYCFAADKVRQRREIIALCAAAVVLLFVSTKVMLDFRGIGLKQYLQGRHYTESQITEEKSFFVDNNLGAICGIVGFFPQRHDYLGWEVAYISLIHPIPRAIWHSKPERMSMSVEDIFGLQGLTISTTFVGEAYMMHGLLAVFAMGAALGALCAWWNRLASPKNSEFGMLIYASGFAAAVITMRSVQWLSTAVLPTIAGIVVGYFLIKGGRRVVSSIRARPARVFPAKKLPNIRAVVNATGRPNGS